MQIKKDETYSSILKVAKEEFLSNGFKNTSMRTISSNAGVGLSNIYNYFKNKDEILREVLKPLLNFMEQTLEAHDAEEEVSLDIFTSKEYQLKNIAVMVSFVQEYRQELNLLLFHSYGSSLEHFRNEYADKYTERSITYLSRLKAKYPTINDKISPFFIHTLTSWMFTILGEIVTHEELTNTEIEAFMSDYIAYGTAGWKAIIKA